MVRATTLRPIKTEADYDAALAEIDRLMDAQPNTADGDRLDLLATLVEAYEAKHHPIEPPGDPVEAVKFHMEQTGLTRADLARLLGSPQRARDFLARRRTLSLPMARRLHREWGIPAESLLGSLPAKPRATHAAARSRAIVRAARTRA